MPAGITIKAGPGNTIMAMPIKSTVKPTVAIISFFTYLALLRISAVIYYHLK
jgi:hypothetical protein